MRLNLQGPKRQDADGTEIQGTYIGGFGLLAYSTKLEIMVDKWGNMTGVFFLWGSCGRNSAEQRAPKYSQHKQIRKVSAVRGQ